jgi:AraC-like DNA-binding protein
MVFFVIGADTGERAGGADRAAPPCTYAEFASHLPHVLCTWTLHVEPGQPALTQRVVPDGCVDLVWFGGDDLEVAGPATGSVDVMIPGGATVVGVRFRPGLGGQALGLPQADLLNQTAPLIEALPRMARTILGSCRRDEGPHRRRALMEGALADRWEAHQPDPRVQAAIRLISASPDARVERIAGRVGLCPRQLRRRFRESVGYGPKTFHRILRLQRLLSLLRARTRCTDLATLALEAGYADQAHMTRECGDLAGQTPVALAAGNANATLEMSDLFKNPPPGLR